MNTEDSSAPPSRELEERVTSLNEGIRASEPRQTIASARQFNDPQRKHFPDRTGNTHYKVQAPDTRSPEDTRPYTSGCNVQMSDNPRWLRFHALSFIQTSLPSPRRMLPQVPCCLLFSSSAAVVKKVDNGNNLS